MSSSLCPPPHRTAAGQAELVTRQRGLSQRQRTMLLLIDGQRDLDTICSLALQAGASAQCLTDLMALGLVALPDAPPTADDAVDESSLLPSSQSLQGESSWSVFGDEADAPADRPLAEARELLIRAVRQEAPMSGALTLFKLKMATTREDLDLLLDEVELRLRKPHRQIIAAQTMRHVRHLLSLPTASQAS